MTSLLKTNTHGGKRKGSGRKPKEPTKTISYRVKVKYADAIHAELMPIIAKYK